MPERAEMTCRCGAVAAAAQIFFSGNSEAHQLLNLTTWEGSLGCSEDTW